VKEQYEEEEGLGKASGEDGANHGVSNLLFI